MDYSEKWGVDVEEAVNLALIDLKLSRDEVEVTILEEPSKGFFGIGQKLAKVRVEKKKQPEPEVKVEAAPEPAPVEAPVREEKPQRRENKNSKKNKDRKRNGNSQREKREPSVVIDSIKKDDLKEIEDHKALDFLKEITDKMGLDVNISARADDSSVCIDMDGRDSGTIIGKRGQTLDAIQYLTSLVVNKDSEKYIKVVVDAENYRSKRQRTLEQLANRLAAKVIKTRKYVRLEPMNPYERKIIHATLQHNPDIITRSEGEEPYRRVIIELKK